MCLRSIPARTIRPDRSYAWTRHQSSWSQKLEHHYPFDPGDRRARLIRCTPCGRRARASIHATAAALEDRWRAEVGADRYAVFREVLIALGEAMPEK